MPPNDSMTEKRPAELGGSCAGLKRYPYLAGNSTQTIYVYQGRFPCDVFGGGKTRKPIGTVAFRLPLTSCALPLCVGVFDRAVPITCPVLSRILTHFNIFGGFCV